MKILVFILRSKNIEQGILKEKIEKQWNNRTLEQFSNRVKKRGRAGIDCALSCCRNEILLLWNLIIKNSINVKIFFSLPIFSSFRLSLKTVLSCSGYDNRIIHHSRIPDQFLKQFRRLYAGAIHIFLNRVFSVQPDIQVRVIPFILQSDWRAFQQECDSPAFRVSGQHFHQRIVAAGGSAR